MIALAVVLFVASGIAWDAMKTWAKVQGERIAADQRAADQRHGQAMADLALERDRFEATRPVAPHEEIVAKVQALESRLNAVESWAKR